MWTENIRRDATPWAIALPATGSAMKAGSVTALKFPSA